MCFIELFGTFQHYIILNQNYTGEDCFYSFGQKIFDPGLQKIESPLDYKMLPLMLSRLTAATEIEKSKISSLYFAGKEEEAIAKINNYLLRGRYFYDYNTCIVTALKNIL